MTFNRKSLGENREHSRGFLFCNVAGSAPAAEKSEPSAGESTVAAICKRNDGRGWRCKNAATKGSSLCSHHLARYIARTSKGSEAASAVKGSRGPRGGDNACTKKNSTTKKKAATKAQKYSEKKKTHEEEKVTTTDPEVYNAACILYHDISEFWTVSHATDVMLVAGMNGGDDDGDDEKEDGMGRGVAMHNP